MATDTSSAFNSAANPSPPSHGTSAGDAPPVTPSQQVISHAPAMDGPSPPGSVGQAGYNQTHVANMQRDGNRSDQANQYTRFQSPASAEQIKTIGKLFAKQAQQKDREKSKNVQQTKNNQQDKDRDRER